MINFLVYIFYFFFILFSVLGFGLLLKNYFKINILDNCYGFIGILGILFVFIYSYLSNLIYAHDKIHNFLFIFAGFLLFIFYIKDKFFLYKKELKKTFIIFSILICGIFIFKSHDDFGYYHFPYSYYLTEQKIIIGLGQILQGFRTPSSIFYFNSILYLPFAEYYLFNLFPVYILGFSNLILLKKIFFTNPNKNNLYLKYLSLLVFIFINIFFYRIGEHGTDRSAQILIFILIIEILDQISKIKVDQKNLNKIYFLTSIIISLKSFYFLYLIFIIPIIFKEFKRNKKFKNFFKIFFLHKSFLISFSLILLVTLSYLFNTGCLIYPVSFTCFESLDWSISKNEVISSNNWFELWSKAGATPNYIVENKEIYIKSFNWLNIWIDEYFFNKVSDFIIGIFVLCLVVYFLFYKNGKIKKSKLNIKSHISVYIILLILLFEWFYNHPALRYGGYCIISLIIFIPLSKIIENIKITKSKYHKVASSLIIISLLVFVGRNINRIYIETNLYNYKPFLNSSYLLDNNHFRMQKFINDLVDNFYDCKNQNANCDISLEPKVSKKFGYYIFNTK